MARRSERIKKAPATHTRGVLRDRSVSRAPSEGVKHVRIRSPTLIGLPPSLNDIVGEASPERAQETSRSSPLPFSSLHHSVDSCNRVLDEVPEWPQGRDSELTAAGAFGSTASSYSESDEEDSTAMLIVGECEDTSAPPSPSSTRASSESGVTFQVPHRDDSVALSRAASSEISAASDSDEEVLSADLIVGEAMGENDPPRPWRSVSVSDDSSQSGWGSGSDTSSHQHLVLIIGEVDDSDGLLAGWDSQSEDEGTPVSSPGADSDVSSPHNAMLVVGEADDSDLDSPPRSSTSEADRGTGESESSCGNTSSADDENSDDSNARTRNSLTLMPVPGAGDSTIEDLSFDFPVESPLASPAHLASRVSTQRDSFSPDSTNPSSSYMRDIDIKVNAAHRLAQLRSERQEVSETLEGISSAEETALALQSAAFSTHPQYWRAYQLSLWIRTTEVNEVWDRLGQH